MSTPLLIDIILIAVLVLFAVLGAHRGFVLTLCSLLAVVVALVGANLLADTLAPKVSDAIQPKLEQSIQESLENAVRDAAQEGDGFSAVQALAVLKEKGGIYQWAADAIEEALDDGITATAAQAAAAAATAVAEQIARGLIFLIGFLLVLVVWSLLSHALDLVAKLPVLSSLNGTLGGILGFVKGLLVLYIAVWVLCDLTGFISPETVAQTKLLLFLTQHSILDLFLAGQSFASQNT